MKKIIALSAGTIDNFASRPGIKRVAVENFLMSAHGLSKSDAFSNAKQDAKSYRWNDATLEAIIEAIAQSQDT